MFDNVQVFTQSSIKITGKQVLYFDPFEIKEESYDADMIFITHDHYDHFSPEDMKKVAKDGTLLIMPEGMRKMESQTGISNVKFLSPNALVEEKGLLIKAIPAYNRLKPFHTRGKGYVGYLVTMDDVVYYIAGDTDMTPDNQGVHCDVAFVPIGGKFTMDYKEAAKFVNFIAPKLAIPTHYGTIVGSPEDGQKFAELVNKQIEVRVMM